MTEVPSTKVAFLGYVVPPDRLLELPQLSFADNRFQTSFLSMLSAKFGTLPVFSSVSPDPGHPAGPAVSELAGLRVQHPGHVPLPVVGGLSKLIRLYLGLARWARAESGSPKVLVCYNTFLLYALVALLLRLRHRVPFVPIAITLPYSADPDSLGNHLQAKVSQWLWRRASGVIAMTPMLAARVAPQSPSCIIRGGVASEAIAAPERAAAREPGPHRLVYAGTLYERYHLATLLQTITLLPAEYELHVYGRGPLAEQVERAARADPRVVYHGAVPADELPAIYAGASVLLAVLHPNDELATMTFPSKIFEYLQTLRPTLVSDLPTLNAGLRGVLEIAPDLSPTALAEQITRICGRSGPEREARARDVASYLHDHLTWPRVADELAGFISRSITTERNQRTIPTPKD